MGKYDAIVQKLPKLPPEVRYSEQGGSNYQAKIEEEKTKHTDRDPDVLFTKYATLRAAAEAKEEEAKALRLQVETLAQLLMEAFEGRGIDSLKLKGIGTLRTDYAPHTKVLDAPGYRQWCIDNGHQDQMQLLWQTTNGIMKERLLSGQEIPDCVSVYCRPTPVFTKEKA